MIVEREINLLPKPMQRRRMWRLYISRFGRFLNRIYLLLALLSIVLVVILVMQVSIKEKMVADDGLLAGRNTDVIAQVRWTNELMRQFEGLQLSQEAWSPQVLDVLRVAPEQVRITGLESQEAMPSVLTITGVTSSRSAVVLFQQRLEKLEWVSQLEAPLQNFALEPTASFSFSLHR